MANEQAPVAPVPGAGLSAQPVAPAPKPVAKDESRVEDVKKEQGVLKDLSAKVEGGDLDYFEQQEAFGKAFEEKEGEDSFRRAARIEREREAAMSSGDPTKDPVAKQKAMDMNTVLPGAQADAAKIKKIGEDKLAEQSPAYKGVK